MHQHIPSRPLEEPAGRRRSCRTWSATRRCGARKVGQIEAVGQRKGTTIPIAARRRPARSASSRPSSTNAGAASCGSSPPRPCRGEGPQAGAHHAGRRAAGRPGRPGRPALRRPGRQAARPRAATQPASTATPSTSPTPSSISNGSRAASAACTRRRPSARSRPATTGSTRNWPSVKPTVIVALGATALKSVLGTANVTLKDSLGKPLRHDGRWVVTAYHPSYVLRVPGEASKRRRSR